MLDSEPGRPWFGQWVKTQREQVYGWTQDECAARVQAHYTALEADLPPDAKRTTFNRWCWSKIETNRKFHRVRIRTVEHVALGLLLPLPTCLAMAGYVSEPAGTDLSHHIGRAIFCARQAASLSVEHVAQTVGVSLERYRSWEGGLQLPDAQQMLQLSYVLDVPIQSLYPSQGRDAEPSVQLTKRQIETAVSLLRRVLVSEPEPSRRQAVPERERRLATA